jgi:hypothetical protein
MMVLHLNQFDLSLTTNIISAQIKGVAMVRLGSNKINVIDIKLTSSLLFFLSLPGMTNPVGSRVVSDHLPADESG